MTTYRGWLVSYDYPPIPTRDLDWSATHPDFDGADDACDSRYVTAATRDELIAEIDHWYDENDLALSADFGRSLIDGMTGEFGYAFALGSLQGCLSGDDSLDTLNRARSILRIWLNEAARKGKA